MRKYLWVSVVALAAVGSAGFGAIHITQNDEMEYGMLDQNHESVNFGDQACGPTSVANSFQFLQTEYGITGLLAADPYDTINTLETYMNTNGTNGTEIGDLIRGKRDYIADKGLSSKISIEGETFFNLGIEGVADNTTPTWDFLFDQVDKGQDVEILINWWDGMQYLGGHYLTVTGMTYDDVADTGTLSFIDPWGGVDLTGTLGSHGAFMQLTYTGGAASAGNDPDNPGHEMMADISAVVAESPIPEPAMMSLVLGSLFLAGRRTR